MIRIKIKHGLINILKFNSPWQHSDFKSTVFLLPFLNFLKLSNFCTHHFNVLQSRIMFLWENRTSRIWFIPKIVVVKNWEKNWLVRFLYKKSFIVAIDHIYQCKELETFTQTNQKYSRKNVKYGYFEIVMLYHENLKHTPSLYVPQTRNNQIDQSGIYRILFESLGSHLNSCCLIRIPYLRN